ncbi:MAG: 3-dehydroquinate synthase [Bacillota bacterium]
MDRLKVDLGARSYEIIIGSGALRELGSRLRSLGEFSRLMLVTNPTVYDLYGEELRRGLGVVGQHLVLGMVPDGEEYKTMEQAQRLIDLAVEHHFDRNSLILTLGGGVIGDLGGFVAAIYQRGVNFVQVPTTLLAMVDSSVGGKVAVNHPRAKNMIGAFHQPRLVLIDTAALNSLSDRDYRSGLAETVKYGIIADQEFFFYLRDNAELINRRDEKVLQYAIHRSCAIKADIVEDDEREDGLRAILNLGHTFGHAIETGSGYGTYRHGEAVAIGMVLATRLAHHLNLLSNSEMKSILDLIQALELNLPFPNLPPGQMVDLMYQDKKMRNGRLRLVLPNGIGRVTIRDDVDRSQLEDFLSQQG